MADEPGQPSMPPREALYAFYILLLIILFATLILVGVYS